MTNTTRRRVAFVVGLAVLGLLAALLLPQRKSSTEVVTVDEPTSAVPTASATTQVPETTTTTVVTTTTVAPTTTVVETTTAPTEPPTTVAPAPATERGPPATVAEAGLSAQSVPDAVAVQPEQPARATRSGPVCTTDPEYCNPPASSPRAEWQWCEQWHDLAAAVGWPESKGATLSYVINRESGCDPNAHNPSGATGLMQIIGGCAPYGSCYDPEANLRRGLDMQNQRGWQPWQVCGFRRNC